MCLSVCFTRVNNLLFFSVHTLELLLINVCCLVYFNISCFIGYYDILLSLISSTCVCCFLLIIFVTN